MMAHTAGPWVLSEYRPTYDDVGGDYSVGYTDADGVYWDIATLEPSRANRKADANLIKAAPDLLATLERICAAESRMSGNNPIAGLCDEARAAIAKAKGEV